MLSRVSSSSMARASLYSAGGRRFKSRSTAIYGLDTQADPGEPSPSYPWTKLRPEGPKIKIWTPGPPYQRVWMTLVVDSHRFAFQIHTCKSVAKTVNLLWLKRTWSDDFWKRKKRFRCTINSTKQKKCYNRVTRPARVRKQSTGNLQVTRNSGLWETIDVSFQALNSKTTDLKKIMKKQIFNYRNLRNVFLDSLQRATLSCQSHESYHYQPTNR